jgi:antitoxin CptB
MNEFAKLSWRCRRGTLELDFLLQNYLDKAYRGADSQEKCLFQQLLAFEDDLLQAYLLENKQGTNLQLNLLINKIKQLAHT